MNAMFLIPLSAKTEGLKDQPKANAEMFDAGEVDRQLSGFC